MTKFYLTIAASVILTTSTAHVSHAQYDSSASQPEGLPHHFENEKLPSIEQYTSLECVPVTLKPKDNDPDPVYKIMVSLTLRSYNDPETLNVIHVRTSGEQVDRTQQYGDAKLWQKQGFNEWHWTGTLKRNPRLTMNGSLYRTADGKWFYEETLFDRRRQD